MKIFFFVFCFFLFAASLHAQSIRLTATVQPKLKKEEPSYTSPSHKTPFRKAKSG